MMEGGKVGEVYGELLSLLSLKMGKIQERNAIEACKFFREIYNLMNALLFAYVSFFLLKRGYVYKYLPEDNGNDPKAVMEKFISQVIEDRYAPPLSVHTYINVGNEEDKLRVVLFFKGKLGHFSPRSISDVMFAAEMEKEKMFLIVDTFTYEENKRYADFLKEWMESRGIEVQVHSPETFVREVLGAGEEEIKEWKTYISDVLREFDTKYGNN